MVDNVVTAVFLVDEDDSVIVEDGGELADAAEVKAVEDKGTLEDASNVCLTVDVTATACEDGTDRNNDEEDDKAELVFAI